MPATPATPTKPTTPALPAVPAIPVTPSMPSKPSILRVPSKPMNTGKKRKVCFLEEENTIVQADSNTPMPLRQLWLADKPDVILEITEVVDGVSRKDEIFISLRTLMVASRAFRYLLKSDNVDSRILGRTPEGLLRLSLLRDDPTCMRLLCRLAQNKDYRAAAHPQLSHYARLVRTAHKYKCTSLILEHAQMYLTEKRIAMAGRQGDMDILTIAYLLRDEVLFESITKGIILNFTGDVHQTFGKEIVPGMVPHKCILGRF